MGVEGDRGMARLFISYSHRDETWKDRAARQLAVLATAGLAVWDDRQIGAGDAWHDEIGRAIDGCDVALLLISAHFLTSAFILGEEVPRLLQRRQGQGIRVVPLILSPCQWTRIPWLKTIQARPKDGRPLSGMSEHEAESALCALAGEIAGLLLPSSVRSAVIARALPTVRPAVDLSKLPVGTPDFLGRDLELGLLDAAWSGAEPDVGDCADGEAARVRTADPADPGGVRCADPTGKVRTTDPTPPDGIASPGAPDALSVWQRKLAFLPVEEAKTADPEQRFAIQIRIDECKEKIRELGS